MKTTRALLEVRDGRLYRASYPSFDHYCQERWGLTKRVAYYRIAALEVVDNVNRGSPDPQLNERRARELKGLPPAAQRQVWEQAKASGQVQHTRLRELAERARAALPTPALEDVRARAEARKRAADDCTQSDDEKGRAMDLRMLKHLARAARIARRRMREALAAVIEATLVTAAADVGGLPGPDLSA